MPLPVYLQYILPPLNVDAGQLEFRINTDGALLYERADPTTETLYVNPPNSITTVAALVKQFDNINGNLSADSFTFGVYDLMQYSGREGNPVTGMLVSENLAGTNGSLFDKICFNEATVQLTLWVTLINPVANTREPFFVGTIDPLQIPRSHLSVWFPNTVNEVQTRELTFTAADLMALIKTKTIGDLLTTILTTQTYDGVTVGLDYFTDRRDYFFAGLRWDPSSIQSAFQGDVGREAGYISDPTSGLRSITMGQLCLALQVTIGYFLNFAEGIDSSFDFYTQPFNGTGYALSLVSDPTSLELIWNTTFGKAIVDLQRFPIASINVGANTFDTGGPFGMYSVGQQVQISTTGTMPAPLVAGTNYYFFNPSGTTFQLTDSPGSTTPIDITTAGSGTRKIFDSTGDFPYKNAWDRNAPLVDVLKKIAYQFGTVFYTQIIESSGVYNPYLKTHSRRTKFGDIPSTWQLVSSKEETQTTTQSAATVVNENDNLKIQAGILANANSQALELSMPWRAHQWGVSQTNSTLTEAFIPLAALWFDQSVEQGKQGLLFQSSTPDNPPNNDANAWIASKFLYLHLEDVSAIYHRSFAGEGAHAGEIGVAACTIKGAPAPGDSDDFFNTLRAPAIFYWQELIGSKITLTRKYYGVLANDGTVQGVRPGLETILPIRTESNGGNNRTFRGIKTSQEFISNTTEVTCLERPSDYAISTIPQLQYISQAGGTSSTAASSTINVTSTPTSGRFGSIVIPSFSTQQNNFVVNLTSKVFYLSSSTDVHITGIVATTDTDAIILKNIGSFTIVLDALSSSSSSANQFSMPSGNDYPLAPNGIVGIMYDGNNSKWEIISTNNGA